MRLIVILAHWHMPPLPLAPTLIHTHWPMPSPPPSPPHSDLLVYAHSPTR